MPSLNKESIIIKNRSTAYLTIDDAPSEDFVNKVDFLFSYRIPAIFFCVGEQIANYRGETAPEKIEEELIYAIKSGFVLGNHSWTHSDFNLLREDQIEKEITSTDKQINQIYEKAGALRPMKLFRFPYLHDGGKNRDYAQAVLRDLGYSRPDFKNITVPLLNEKPGREDLSISCTFDTMDWSVGNPDYMYGLRVLDDLYYRMEEDKPFDGCSLNYSKTNHIIMMHDHKKLSKIFPLLIKRMKEKEIRFEEPEWNFSREEQAGVARKNR